MNAFDQLNEKYSITSHFVKRWKQRVKPNATTREINNGISNIIKHGNRYTINDNHYRICHYGFCIVFMKLSPLHSLAKTVYEIDESTLSAI